MFECPVAQKRQCPQTGRNEVTTWSPSLTRETPGPTFSITPAPSWPPTIGKRGHDVAVAQVLVGVAQARGHPADQHLALLGLVEIELGDLPVATGLPQHRCPGLHEALSSCDADVAIVLRHVGALHCRPMPGRAPRLGHQGGDGTKRAAGEVGAPLEGRRGGSWTIVTGPEYRRC